MAIKVLGKQAHYCGALLDQAEAETAASEAIEIYDVAGMSVQIDHGNITGTLVLQSSNDGTTFYTVQGGSFAAISGSGGEVVEIGSLRSRFYRFSYEHDSGTGLLRVSVHVKGVG
jgi:hypothetical protein